MCGIAGFTGPERPAALQAMLGRLAHRGPDDRDAWASPRLSLGHNRLAIIDLSPAGRQPMADPTGQVRLVFNGEIYNFQALRRELAPGYDFRTRTDTEAILAAYLAWGPEGFLERLEGMFALALWDERDGRLILARDRMGIKPLYWAVTPAGLAFASELRALLAHPDVSADPDPEALPGYLLQRFVPAPRTAVRAVRKLAPGCGLAWADGRLEEFRWWRPDFTPRYFPGDEDQAAALVRERFQAAVDSHLVADVPVAVMLSAGVDSSLVAACAARSQARLRTFTIGFAGQEDNEFGPARELARRLGAEHREIVLEPAHLGLLPAIAMQNDEPVAGPSSLAYHLALGKAREHCTVVLFGHGADEVFSGYEQTKILRRVRRLGRIPGARSLFALGAAAARGLFPRDAAFERLLGFARAVRAGDEMDAYFRLMAVCGPEETARLLRSRVRAEPPEAMAAAFAEEADPETAAVRFEQAGWLADDILHRVDRMTMAHSLEGRVPFLDAGVVALGNALDNNLKLRDGQEKHILRRAFAQDLPPENLLRRKQRFNTPIDRFFGPAFEALARRLFASDHPLLNEVFDPAALLSLLEYRRSPAHRLLLRRNKLMSQYYARQIWSVVVYLFWHCTVVEGQAPEEVAGRWGCGQA